jgi:hypothetical protein
MVWCFPCEINSDDVDALIDALPAKPQPGDNMAG